MDPSQLETLRTRLTVCKEQYLSASSLNTRSRKQALAQEIESIERQLADALGLEGPDSDDEGHKNVHENVDVLNTVIKTETTTRSMMTRPSSTPIPSAVSSSSVARTRHAQLSTLSSGSSPARSRSPPSFDHCGPQGNAKRPKLDTGLSLPYIKPDPERATTTTTTTTISHSIKAAPSSSSSSAIDQIDSSSSTSVQVGSPERKSITAALVDAGDDMDDIEELLRAQQQLERELAVRRRQREEEDERLARMLQDEEYAIVSGVASGESSISARGTDLTGSMSTVATGGPSQVSSVVPMTKAEKERQEREDFEMAKLFAESEATSFNLATMRPHQTQANSHSFPQAKTTSSSSTVPIHTSSTSTASTSHPTQQHSNPSFSSVSKPAPIFPIFGKQPPKPAATPSSSMVDPYANYPPSVAKRMAEMNKLKKSEQDLLLFLDALERANKAAGQAGTSKVAGKSGIASGFTSALTALSSFVNNGAGSSSSGNNHNSSSGAANSNMPLRPPNLPPTAAARPPIDLTKPHVDLTRPIVDLTRGDPRSVVHVASDSDDDDLSDLRDWGDRRAFNWYFSSEEEYDSDDEDRCYHYKQWGYDVSSSSSALYSSYGSSAYQYMRQVSEDDIKKELQALLSNIKTLEEIPPEDRLGTPEGMARNMVLLEHQKIGLTWLQKMEDGINKGGILADDMGLGKTVQSIALMVSRRGQPPADLQVWDNRRVYYAPPPTAALIKTKATLIVAPVGLVYQWENEIMNKTTPGLLKVHVHYRNRKVFDPQELARYDVIITTYGSLASDMGQPLEHGRKKKKPIGDLFKLYYHRIILDEAHMIKNKATKNAIACTALEAKYRWCLTGTPFQNKITELFSLIQFLRIRPYDEYVAFARDIANPIQKLKSGRDADRQRIAAMHRLQALMKAICLRRSKKDEVDGKPILCLPPRIVNKTPVEFSPDEAAFYHALETRTVDRFNAYVKAGTVMKNYSNVLLLLLRLRQACCHPHLIKDFLQADEAGAAGDDGRSPEDRKARMKKLLDKLSEAIITRLLEEVNLDAPECPICMDVGEQSVLLSKCGHIYCQACIAAHLERHEPEDRKCPECRGLTKLEETIPVKEFVHRYKPAPPPSTVPAEADPKGKGKAVDNGDGADVDLNVLTNVPPALDDWISSAKIDKMTEIVEANMAKGEKTIVFSQFRTLLELIERPLADRNIRYLKYDGKVNPDARNQIIQDFMNPAKDYPVILISLKCGSLGLNLVAANHVIMMDPWWNPAIENQAIDRAHRIGQTRDVHVHRLAVPGTVEDRIYRLQEDKQALIDGALGESDTIPKLARLNLQDLIYLFRGTRD